MRVYIASKYIEHKEINQKIHDTLLYENIESFLPKSINVDAITFEQMFYVAEKCYQEIENSDIILIVSPFGKSVSSEVGYAISLKRKKENIKLILLNTNGKKDKLLDKEAMIMPYIDLEISSINELIEYLKSID